MFSVQMADGGPFSHILEQKAARIMSTHPRLHVLKAGCLPTSMGPHAGVYITSVHPHKKGTKSGDSLQTLRDSDGFTVAKHRMVPGSSRITGRRTCNNCLQYGSIWFSHCSAVSRVLYIFM